MQITQMEKGPRVSDCVSVQWGEKELKLGRPILEVSSIAYSQLHHGKDCPS